MLRFKQNWISYCTITRKEVHRFIRIWPQTILPSAITMSLYFVIFGNLIGPRIGNMDGFSYIDYIVPGLIMMSVITGAYYNVSSAFFSAKFQRCIEEIIVSPTSNQTILLGYVTGGVARGILVGLIVTLVSMFFTNLKVVHPFLTILVVLMTAVMFSLAGLVNGVFAKKFDDVSIIPTFVLTPLTYLGGIFYSISLLPSFWQKVTLGNPIFYMINGFRYGMLGDSDININVSLSVIGIFIVAFYLTSYWLLNKGYGVKN